MELNNMTLYKYDLHVHTAEVSPCGEVKAEKVVNLYDKVGYEGMVITDHFRSRFFDNFEKNVPWEKKIDQYLEGYKKAKNVGEKLGITVLMGLEMRFSRNKNDYLIYGVDEEFLKKYKDLHKMGLNKFNKFIKEVDQDILIYQAHPFRTDMTIVEPDLLDGIEVHNGNPRHNSRNYLARAFAAKNNLKQISGSDFHELEDLDRGGVLLPKKPQTESELVDILIKNRIYKLLEAENENQDSFYREQEI